MNPVVHFELFAKDAPALGTFYAELFGWSLQPLPDIGYVLIDTCAGAGISGGILRDRKKTTCAADRPERAATRANLSPATHVVF